MSARRGADSQDSPATRHPKADGLSQSPPDDQPPQDAALGLTKTAAIEYGRYRIRVTVARRRCSSSATIQNRTRIQKIQRWVFPHEQESIPPVQV